MTSLAKMADKLDKVFCQVKKLYCCDWRKSAKDTNYLKLFLPCFLVLQASSSKEYTFNDSGHIYPRYKIKLRLGQLLVRQASNAEEIHLLSSRNEQFLAEWLQYCDARLVRIDPVFGESKLQTWANLCKRFDKEIFLWIPRHRELPEYRYRILWLLKRSLDWIIAAILLIILSPVLVAIALILFV